MLTLLGGLALLLLGIERISSGLNAWSGHAMRRLMARATGGRLQAFLAGTAVAAVTQSGTASALTTLGLVASGLMAVAPGIAMSLGAKLGGTLAIQVAAFEVYAASLPLIGLGFLAQTWGRTRNLGALVFGLGLLFYGLDLTIGATSTLGSNDVVVFLLERAEQQSLAVLFAGLFLGAMTSSANAVTAIALGFLVSGVGTLPTAVALMLGGNVGATLLPLISARRLDVSAERVALAHLILKALAAVLLVLFIDTLLSLVPQDIASSARTMANLHTGFNLAVGLLALPIVGLMARLLSRILPERDDATRPKYLTAEVVADAPLARRLVQREVVRVSDQVLEMMQVASESMRSGSWDVVALSTLEAKVDRLTHMTVDYLARYRRANGEDASSERSLLVVTELEHMGDQIRRMMRREARLVEQGLNFSRVGREELADTANRLVTRMRAAFTALATGDVELANGVTEGRPEFESWVAAMRVAHLGRLEEFLAESHATSSHHLELLSLMRQIDASVTRVANWACNEAERSGEA